MNDGRRELPAKDCETHSPVLAWLWTQMSHNTSTLFWFSETMLQVCHLDRDLGQLFV